MSDARRSDPFDNLPPADVEDPVIEAYKKHVDVTLLLENLKLTPTQRVEKMEAFLRVQDELRRAGQKLRENGR